MLEHPACIGNKASKSQNGVARGGRRDASALA